MQSARGWPTVRAMPSRKTARRPTSKKPAAPASEPSSDGRHRRSEETRRRLHDAMVALMARENEMPTIGRVAAQAGVGLRTLYQHFPDAPALYAGTFDHVVATTLATMPPVSPEGPLAERIAGFVERRARVCEAWTPIWRVALRFSGHDAGFRERIERVNQLLRGRAEILYAPELARLAPPQRTLVLDLLLSMTEMEAWEHLRTQCGRDVEAARAAWRFSIAALFDAAARLLQTTD